MKTLKKRKRRPHLPPNKVREDKRRKKPKHGMTEAELSDVLASLTTEDWEQFVEKLRNPPPPNEALANAFKNHITHSMASDDCPYPELW